MEKFTKMMMVLFAAAVLSVGVLFTACVKKGDGKVDTGTEQSDGANNTDDGNGDASQTGVRGARFFEYYDGVDDDEGYVLLHGLNTAGQAELLKYTNKKVFIPAEIDGKKVRLRGGNTALRGFSNVKEIEFASGLEVITAWAFRACAELTAVVIPDTVTEIGANAFDSCSALRNITIPNSAEKIGSGAFTLCSGLTDIYFAGTAAEWASVCAASFSASICYYPTEKDLTKNYTQSAHYAVTAHCANGNVTVYSVDFTAK